MKVKKLIAVTSVCCMTLGMGAIANAAVHIWEDPGAWSSSVFCFDYAATPKYTANELSLDMFGSYIHGEEKFSHLFQTSIRHDGKFGGGVGLNYFITPQFGLMTDINISDNGGRFIEDRKSTRLNSSHSQISYAVFCLQKKNTRERHPSL